MFNVSHGAKEKQKSSSGVAAEYREWKAVLRRSITGSGEKAPVQGSMPSKPLYGQPLPENSQNLELKEIWKKNTITQLRCH